MGVYVGLCDCYIMGRYLFIEICLVVVLFGYMGIEMDLCEFIDYE